MSAGIILAWAVCGLFMVGLIALGVWLSARGAWPRTPAEPPRWGARR